MYLQQETSVGPSRGWLLATRRARRAHLPRAGGSSAGGGWHVRMVNAPRAKERLLLLEVTMHDAGGPPNAAAVIEAVGEALQRTTGQDSPPPLHMALHSPQTKLSLLRTPLASARSVRETIPLVHFVGQRPASIRCERVFGNHVTARRAVALRLEADLWRKEPTNEAHAKAARALLGVLAERQRK